MVDATHTPEAAEIRKQIADAFTKSFNSKVATGEIQAAPIPDGTTKPGTEVPVEVPSSPQGQEAPTAPAPGTPTPEGLILGKYKSMEALENGYHHIVHQNSDLIDANTALKSQLAAFVGGANLTPGTQQATVPDSSQGARSRVNPVERNPIPVDWVRDPAVAKAAEETGIDASIFARLAESVYDKASREVDNVLTQRLAPLAAQAEADQYIRMHYPEALNHTQEIDNFLKTNPDVADAAGALMQSGKVKQAAKYAWEMYTIAAGINTQKKMQANAAVAEEERLSARAAANMPASVSGTAVHAEQQTGISDEQIAEWKKQAQEGSEAAKVHLRRVFAAPILQEIARRDPRPAGA